MSGECGSIVAELHMLPTDAGGRKTPFVAGNTRYRPQFVIDAVYGSTTCFIDEIEGKEGLAPGESGLMFGRLLRPEFFVEHLKPGTGFELHEGPRCVGRGIILKIGNQ